MTRGRDLMGIFRQKKTFFKGFGSLRGQSVSLDSLEGHPEKGWYFRGINCIFSFY
jgi:hypothetical protein